MDLAWLVDEVLARLSAVSGQALVLAALVWALCRYLPRLDAGTRCWLWWLVAVQMMLGLLWPAPVGLPLLPVDPAPAVLAAQAPMAVTEAAGTLPPVFAATALPDEATTMDWRVLLVAAWAIGVGVLSLRTLREFLQLRRRIVRSRICDDVRVRDEYERLGMALGIARLPALRISDEIDSPQLVGPMRPVLLLPAEARMRMGADDLRMTLHHELAHLRRRDLWWSWMPVAARHLFFFHPIAHLAAREYALAREVACDAAVLADERHAAQDYGRLLVKLGVARATPAVALAGASPTFRMLKRRLLMLQHTASPLRASALALTIGAVLLGVVPYRLIAGAAPVADPAPTPVASPANAPAATPAARPVAVTAPRAKVVSRASDMPPPPAPPAPPNPQDPPAPVSVPVPAAPPAPAPPVPPPVKSREMTGMWHFGSGNGDAYVLIQGDEVTMAGPGDDVRTAQKLQRNGESLLWVRKDGTGYVVRDAAVLRQVKAAHAPMAALGEQQGELGERQGALGRRQGELGARQGELGARIGTLSTQHAAALVNQRATATQEAEFDRKVEALGKEQEALAKQQEALARQQEPLARQQEVLARKQEAATVTMQREMDRILSDAIRSGAAQKL